MSLQEALHELFVVDQQLRGLQSRMEAAGADVRAQQDKLDQLVAQIGEVESQLKQTQASEANLESEVNGFEERIDKLRDQMNNARTNKEYSALLVEVNTLKLEKEKLEERALELIGQIEQLQEQLEQLRDRHREQERIKAVADGKLAARREEVGDQLEQVRARRESAARAVPSAELAVFDRLAESLDGEAMCPVEQDDPRHMEFTCGGCFMSMPTEVVNQLGSQDQLVQCPSCKRILYLSEPVKEAMGIRS